MGSGVRNGSSYQLLMRSYTEQICAYYCQAVRGNIAEGKERKRARARLIVIQPCLIALVLERLGMPLQTNEN